MFDRATKEQAACALTSKALVAARNRGLFVTLGVCDVCNEAAGQPERVCVCCAVILFRDLGPGPEDIEERLARIFDLPFEWVLDFIGGFDGQAPEHRAEFPNAARLGRKLSRQYVNDPLV